MKYLVYVSQVVSTLSGAAVPAGLSTIFSVARKTNVMFNITGVLSYRKGYYIQVIEGEDASVDQLFSNISKDQRHENVTVIMTGQVDDRSFPSWDMKLLESVRNDLDFRRFLKKHSDAVQAMPAEHFSLLEHFLRSHNRGRTNFGGFSGTTLELKAWPDFTKFTPSPIVIELCARLTKKPYSYEALLNSGYFGTQQQLDKILEQFKTQGILKLVTTQADANGYMQSKKSTGFYSKMKSFLGLN